MVQAGPIQPTAGFANLPAVIDDGAVVLADRKHLQIPILILSRRRIGLGGPLHAGPGRPMVGTIGQSFPAMQQGSTRFLDGEDLDASIRTPPHGYSRLTIAAEIEP